MLKTIFPLKRFLILMPYGNDNDFIVEYLVNNTKRKRIY